MTTPYLPHGVKDPISLYKSLRSTVKQFEEAQAEFSQATAKGPLEAAYFLRSGGTALIRLSAFAHCALRLLSMTRDEEYWSDEKVLFEHRKNGQFPVHISQWAMTVFSYAEEESSFRYLPSSTSDSHNIYELAEKLFYSTLYHECDVEVKLQIMTLKHQRVEAARAEAEERRLTRLREEEARKAEVEASKKARRAERRAARKGL